MPAHKESPALPRVYAWFYGLIAEDTPLLNDLHAHGLPVDVQHPLRHTTALMEAVRLGRATLVSWLLERGAAPATLCGMPKGSPLHGAVSLKHWQIAETLLKSMESVSVVDGYGRTPLHTLCAETLDDAALTEVAILANLLIDKACPLDALDREGISALHYAVINGRDQLATLLLKRGAAPNILVPDSKVSPITIAALEKNLPLATLLLEYGADPHIPTKDGITAADLMPALKRASPKSSAAMQQEPVQP